MKMIVIYFSSYSIYTKIVELLHSVNDFIGVFDSDKFLIVRVIRFLVRH